MQLDDRIRRIIDQYAIDRDETAGLSPCLVREALLDYLACGGLSLAEVKMITATLANEPLQGGDKLSARPEITWLCTRFAELPDCSHSPWEELRLQRDLVLLRGGVQQAIWLGYRNFFNQVRAG